MMTLQLSFDHALDPATTLTPAAFRVQRADSTSMPVAQVYTQTQFQRVRAARDSARAAARMDSIAKADTTAPRPPAVPDPASDLTGRRGPATVATPKPSVPAPARDVVIELDATTPLMPLSAYRITAIETRSLSGVARTSDRAITVLRRDTTATKRP